MLNLICHGYWFSASHYDKVQSCVAWAVGESVKGLWHQIGRPRLLHISGAFSAPGTTWAVMTHHRRFALHSIEEKKKNIPVVLNYTFVFHYCRWRYCCPTVLFVPSLKGSGKANRGFYSSRQLGRNFRAICSRRRNIAAELYRACTVVAIKILLTIASVQAYLKIHSARLLLLRCVQMKKRMKYVFLKVNRCDYFCWCDSNWVFPLFSRFHPHLRRHFKRQERDDRKPRLSIWISKWSELYLGDCCRGGEQDSYSFSIFRCGGGIWLFIFVRRASAPRKPQDEVRKRLMKPWYLEGCVWRPSLRRREKVKPSMITWTEKFIFHVRTREAAYIPVSQVSAVSAVACRDSRASTLPWHGFSCRIEMPPWL